MFSTALGVNTDHGGFFSSTCSDSQGRSDVVLESYCQVKAVRFTMFDADTLVKYSNAEVHCPFLFYKAAAFDLLRFLPVRELEEELCKAMKVSGNGFGNGVCAGHGS